MIAYYDNMGIAHDENHKQICSRCGKHARTYKMSWFNTQMICLACQKVEEKDPRYKDAKEAERQAVMNGNYNFKGIGYC